MFSTQLDQGYKICNYVPIMHYMVVTSDHAHLNLQSHYCRRLLRLKATQVKTTDLFLAEEQPDLLTAFRGHLPSTSDAQHLGPCSLWNDVKMVSSDVISACRQVDVTLTFGDYISRSPSSSSNVMNLWTWLSRSACNRRKGIY